MYIQTLVKIKNAKLAGKKSLKVPFSKMDMAVLEALVKAGYLASVEKKGRSLKKVIAIELKEDKANPVFSEIKLWSKPSRRLYRGYKEIRPSHQGYGNYFFSTPKGILSDAEARKQKVGGEILFEIW
ncbi:MAG TPA: 30S ribosomal protein S8 [Candidatus Colwellbacteria bacterium]|mgnify:FL=1|nr:30S ribosomal protein S8 [Candidatus Colwellbacteria bacterium]